MSTLKAETRWSGLVPAAPSPLRRSVLPSSAMRSDPSGRKPVAQAMKQASNRGGAIENDAEPVFLGRAEEILRISSEKRKVVFAPIGDLIIIVVSSDTGACHQKQDLRQRVLHLRRFARITDVAKMIQQQAQTVFDEDLFHGIRPRS